MFPPISPHTGGLQTLAGPAKGNRLETADAQNVWLKLVDHLGRLHGPAALSGWLATTTRRECGRILHADTKGRAVPAVPDVHPRRRMDRAARTLGSVQDAEILVIRQELLGQRRPVEPDGVPYVPRPDSAARDSRHLVRARRLCVPRPGRHSPTRIPERPGPRCARRGPSVVELCGDSSPREPAADAGGRDL